MKRPTALSSYCPATRSAPVISAVDHRRRYRAAFQVPAALEEMSHILAAAIPVLVQLTANSGGGGLMAAVKFATTSLIFAGSPTEHAVCLT